MAPEILTPENATLAGLAAAALYAFWRRIRQDNTADKTASREAVFRDDILELNKQLTERCDRFAHERNKALSEIATLRGEIAVLKGRIRRASGSCTTPQTCGLEN